MTNHICKYFSFYFRRDKKLYATRKLQNISCSNFLLLKFATYWQGKQIVQKFLFSRLLAIHFVIIATNQKTCFIAWLLRKKFILVPIQNIVDDIILNLFKRRCIPDDVIMKTWLQSKIYTAWFFYPCCYRRFNATNDWP